MNERIRELLSQAMAIVINGSDPDGDVEQMYIPSEFTKKFAQLIIKECVGILDDEGVYGPYSCGIRSAAYRIKKRFGVEE
jgi:hypothetical protein